MLGKECLYSFFLWVRSLAPGQNPVSSFRLDLRQLQGFSWKASQGGAAIPTPELVHSQCIAVFWRDCSQGHPWMAMLNNEGCSWDTFFTLAQYHSTPLGASSTPFCLWVRKKAIASFSGLLCSKTASPVLLLLQPLDSYIMPFHGEKWNTGELVPLCLLLVLLQ